MEQAKIIGNKFTSKGYNKNFIEDKIQEVYDIPREKLIQDKVKESKQYQEIPLIMNFNTQHKQIEQIIKRHWSLLLADRQLQSILPEKPRFTYRRAPTLRDLVAKNVPDPPKRSNDLTFFQGKGFYPCRRCYACRNTNLNGQKCTNFISTSTNKEYVIKDFISCRTEGVVYVLQCTCLLQYIGRTKRPLWKRIREHIQNIRSGYPKHSVSRHFALHHNKDPTHIKFWAIDKYKPHWRGSNKIRELSKSESRWIFEMCTLSPRGLNIDFDLNCFISDF